MTYDSKANRAYIYIREFEERENSRQYDVAGPDINGSLTLDFDREGRLLGIEVRSPLNVLPRGLLDDAERV